MTITVAQESNTGSASRSGTQGASPAAVAAPFRGVFFNPYVRHDYMAAYPWPVFDKYYGTYRDQLRAALADLVRDARVNLIAMFVPIPFTLAHPPGTL